MRRNSRYTHRRRTAATPRVCRPPLPPTPPTPPPPPPCVCYSDPEKPWAVGMGDVTFILYVICDDCNASGPCSIDWSTLPPGWFVSVYPEPPCNPAGSEVRIWQDGTPGEYPIVTKISWPNGCSCEWGWTAVVYPG